ncbi:MAG: dethiobiotin synthase [Candidatus Brocadiia bacterium]
MSGIFITGTDTAVGKTVICGCLARFLREEGRDVVTQKLVQTGCEGYSEDLLTHLRLGGEDRGEHPEKIEADRCPCILGLPASPHLAAAEEDTTVNPEELLAAFRRLHTDYEMVLVEGAGGPAVPVTEELLLVDLVARLSVPAILVADNRLGCINHSLLAVEALHRREIPIIGIIFTNTQSRPDDAVHRDNPRIIETMSDVPVLGELPYLPGLNDVHKHFEPIGRTFLSHFPKVIDDE